ncbi:site-specific integrase [Fructilactobacillus cliffordii]|uniref:site-specific integrase n=1 Tax=Fructilactobacillus cliffordii TaxID=2940299 RepID=UPI002092FF14|nr:site-specific integrase [Fructilactobacillus cliffordii]USS86449.1 site-specific integrase [Fructilactobacillus cliffordii]
MADIRKRGKAWQARIDYYDDNGKRHFKSKTGFKSKREAQVFISQMIVDKSSGQFVPNVPPLFYDYFWNWFQTYKEKTVTERTKRDYIHVKRVLEKYLPQTKVDEMNRERYQSFLDDYGSNHSKATVSKLNSLINACVQDGIYDGKIKKDFVKRTSIVYDRSKTWKVEYLNESEMMRLVDYLMQTRNCHFTSKYMILLAIFTGMRLGEIQALKWDDLNLNFKTIKISKSWNSENEVVQPTKNESSKRIIRVNDEILEVIDELKQNKSDFIFTNQYGSIPTSSAVNKTLKNGLQELGINKQGFHFHSLRHTHVAYLLAHDVDIYVISKRLGHSNVSTTTNVYSYLIDEYKNRADNHIESILNGMTEETKKDASVN